MKNRLSVLWASAILVSTLAACSLRVNEATPIASADASLPSPATTISLYQQVTLTPVDKAETGQNPTYNVTVKIPVLIGSDDPRVSAFNALAASLVQAQVDEFKNNVATAAPSFPADSTSSALDIQYYLLSPSLEIISIKFDISVYIQGAPHPFLVNRTLNFDLESGQELSLDSLFLPNSDYLITIANFCAAELQKRNIGFDETGAQGAAPLPENYRNWNLTADGVLITFEQYQVAPGAAGPQTVLIPFSELAALANPQGALAKFLQ